MGTKIGEEVKSVFLKVTSAFTVDGVIAKVGSIVEVLEDDAKALLNRGKAVLATAEDALGLGGDGDGDDDDDTGDATGLAATDTATATDTAATTDTAAAPAADAPAAQ